MLIRPAGAADFPAIAALYGYWVQNGLGTFEEAPPGADELAARASAIVGCGLPYLVAEVDRKLAGYAYAAPYRPRTGYRYTAEDTVYVAPHLRGRGVGRALLLAVLDACEARGVRQVLASIGDGANTASVALHRACGFELAGVLRAVGFKYGRWVDVVFMQRSLNGGDAAAPQGSGWAG